MYESLHAGRIDFLVLAGDPKTSNTNKLIIAFSNFACGCVLIEIGKCKVEGLLPELEAQVHINQPIHQNLPHLMGNMHEQLLSFLALTKTCST